MEKNLSTILRALMQQKNIHTTELARRVNLKQPTVQRIVSGTYQHPHKKTLKPIADFFGLTLDQLTGLQPISELDDSNSEFQHIPFISFEQAVHFSIKDTEKYSYIVVEKKMGKKLFAMQMNDASMEPLFPKNTLLIFNTNVTPMDRCYVAVKYYKQKKVVFRQLLVDGADYYIKPLSPDFVNFIMTNLSCDDMILGVLIQARMDYINI